jgi:hypothetical protein
VLEATSQLVDTELQRADEIANLTIPVAATAVNDDLGSDKRRQARERAARELHQASSLGLFA